MTKESFVHQLFDLLSPHYDLFNRVASLGMDRGWRRRTIDSLELVPGARVLDLASGTGDLALESVHRILPIGDVVACDLSHPMLNRAQRRFSRHPVAGWHVRFAQARAESLPFPSQGFDAATIGFSPRNVTGLKETFAELLRVLRPGGRIALLEFGRPRNPLLWLGHWIWLTLAIPALGLLTTGRLWPFLYLRRSILGFMDPRQVLALLSEVGFAQPKAQPLQGGIVILYQAHRAAAVV